MLCAMFAQHCAEPFVIEPVTVIYEDDYPANMFAKGGDTCDTPTMKVTDFKVDVNRMKALLNLEELSTDEICAFLQKMMMPATQAGDNVSVKVPCTRPDVMHECDIAEDLAIAYGYNNLKICVPQMMTEIREQPVSRITDLLRNEVALAGFNECL